jgi:hypothetical protein
MRMCSEKAFEVHRICFTSTNVHFGFPFADLRENVPGKLLRRDPGVHLRIHLPVGAAVFSILMAGG